MGDFNLDLPNYEQHITNTGILGRSVSSYDYSTDHKTTRVTAHSATLIDNIFTNCFSQNILSGNILNDLSDHFPIFAFFNHECYPHKKELNSFTRDFSDKNLFKFRSCLSQVDWTGVVSGQDPNTTFDAFLSEYNKHFEKCFLVKTLKPNLPNKPRTPWISKGILVSVRKKNRLYKMFIKRPTARREQQYKAYKNKLNYLIRIAKRTYYDDEFA